MEELKTMTVAKKLGVSNKTIHAWVRKYDIPCQKNSHGHYIFDNFAFSLLEKIKFEQAATYNDVFDIPEMREADLEARIAEQVDFHLQMVLEEKINPQFSEITQSLYNKADIVASTQLLQHRQEIEELTKKIDELSKQMAECEEKIASSTKRTTTEVVQKQRGLLRFLS